MRNISDDICKEMENKRFMFNNVFFSKMAPFMRLCGKKYRTAIQTTDDISHAHALSMQEN